MISPRAFLLYLALLLTGEKPVTVWLAGDSTMAEKAADKRPETGWGEMLGQFFVPGEVQVANRAMNGRSSKSFIAEGRWTAIVDSLSTGDYVFIQFGHNDESKDKGERYSTPEEFKANLTRMVRDVRAKGGVPVLLTPIERRRFDDAGRLVETHGAYPGYTRDVARALKVPLIDMQRASRDILASYGPDSSAKLFLQLETGAHPNYPDGVHDNTHLRPRGAELLARSVVDGIRALKLGLATRLRKA